MTRRFTIWWSWNCGRWKASGPDPRRNLSGRIRRRTLSMRTRTRSSMTVTGLVAIALAAAACSSGGGASPGAGRTQTPGPKSGVQGPNPGTRSPHGGGTLHMLAPSDGGYFDYNISYYTISYLRLWM